MKKSIFLPVLMVLAMGVDKWQTYLINSKELA
jgi:hypothetical protein